MGERGRRSLLDFAIAGSFGVVPILLVVLFGVGAGSPSKHPEVDGESHVSVRQLAAMRTFEHGIVRIGTVRPALPDGDALLALVPACAADWGRPDGIVERLRAHARRSGVEPPGPAQRIAVQLGALDRALQRMGETTNRRVVDAVGFDSVRWAEAARHALATPIEAPRYPGRHFQLRCDDLALAIAALSRANGRMLATLQWRGTEVERTTATWRPEQMVAVAPRVLARSNPWTGIPGCVYLFDAANATSDRAPAFHVKHARAANDRVCTDPAVFADGSARLMGPAPAPISGDAGSAQGEDDPRWQVPPSLDTLLRPLDPLQRPASATYRHYAHTPERSGDQETNHAQRRNAIALGGTLVDVGFSVDLTIDPTLQALAQKTAACYTGRQDICRALGMRRAEDAAQPIGHRLLESAMVRMAAIAIIDVETGRIEALAGALSPCTRQEYDGPGRSAGCDARLPYPLRYRPDALQNAAVFHDAMPASLVKPVMAAAFLSNARVGPQWLAAERNALRSAPPANSLRWQLMRSDSARFLDRMFCSDQDFGPCSRVWEIQAAAKAFGWNAGCESGGVRCGTRDLLFGRRSATADDANGEPSFAAWVPYGRLMVEPSGESATTPFRLRAPAALDSGKIKRCAAGADGKRHSGDDWEKCSGGSVVDVVAEGWGQGHARSTALGAAGMMSALAAAANGQASVRQPHLVRAIRGVAHPLPSPLAPAALQWASEGVEPGTITREAADVILNGLSFSHRTGTARRACEQIFEARVCREIDWIAGKTGTPTFPNDDRSLDAIAALCGSGTRATRAEREACGALRPYKWYVAAYRTDRTNPRWTKAIGVLTERNWLAHSGIVHGAGDHGPNPAAEIALQIAGRHVLGTNGR